MTQSKPFLAALHGEIRNRPPFWLMRQAGRYLPEYREIRCQTGGFLDLCFSPDKATEVTLQPLRRFGMDAAILFSDILVIPLAMGCDLRFEEGEGPRMTPLSSVEAVAHLSVAAIDDTLSPVYDTVANIRANLDTKTALIGFAGSPWTVAAYMLEGAGSRDFSKARSFALSQPKAFSDLLEKLHEASLHYLSRQIEAGAEALQLFDSWAGVLSEQEFDNYVIAPTRKLVSALRARYPHIPIIGFARGAGALLARYAEGTGVQAVGLDSGMPLGWAKEQLGGKLPLQGNLDPLSLLHQKEEALHQARACISAMKNTPYIFNLGHGVLQHTPVEHVEALCSVLREG